MDYIWTTVLVYQEKEKEKEKNNPLQKVNFSLEDKTSVQFVW